MVLAQAVRPVHAHPVDRLASVSGTTWKRSQTISGADLAEWSLWVTRFQVDPYHGGPVSRNRQYLPKNAREALADPRFLLIGPYDPHSGEYTFLAPPLGVWRLAGVLQSAGIGVGFASTLN